MNNRERFMAALKGEPADRVPVFPLLMFFTADRAGLPYREYATNGRALAQAQLLVQQRFDLDAITVCSDAFRVSADLGGDMAYPETKTPYLRTPLVRSAGDVEKLGHPDPANPRSRMGDRVLATSEMVRPWRPGSRAGLGRHAPCSLLLCGVSQFMLMLQDDPVTAHACWLIHEHRD
jgi:uroporphyrinogen-III decarboxylase